MRLSVSGTLTPDATIADTGEPAGTYNGESYWHWGDWFLFFHGEVLGQYFWRITKVLGGGTGGASSYWEAVSFSNTPIGTYNPKKTATGIATVAEYVPPDLTPNAFAFTDVSDADPSTLYTSDAQTITGMDAATPISVSGCEYSLDGGPFTSDAGTINPGQSLRLRATSSAESEGVATVSVTVGTLTVDWTITTGVLSSIVSNIVGSAMLQSRIFNSRIVRGHV